MQEMQTQQGQRGREDMEARGHLPPTPAYSTRPESGGDGTGDDGAGVGNGAGDDGRGGDGTGDDGRGDDGAGDDGRGDKRGDDGRGDGGTGGDGTGEGEPERETTGWGSDPALPSSLEGVNSSVPQCQDPERAQLKVLLNKESSTPGSERISTMTDLPTSGLRAFPAAVVTHSS